MVQIKYIYPHKLHKLRSDKYRNTVTIRSADVRTTQKYKGQHHKLIIRTSTRPIYALHIYITKTAYSI